MHANPCASIRIPQGHRAHPPGGGVVMFARLHSSNSRSELSPHEMPIRTTVIFDSRASIFQFPVFKFRFSIFQRGET
jgi:hypothetical protein